QAGRQYAGVVLEAELAEHVVGLGANLLVVLREHRHLHSFALAREDRQCDIIEYGQAVEQVHDLEAARDPGLDPLVNGGERDIVALEQDLSAVGRQLRADEVDERSLAGAVRADERKELAFVDDEIHAVARSRIAELFSQLDGLEKNHADFSFGRNLPTRSESAPTIP